MCGRGRGLNFPPENKNRDHTWEVAAVSLSLPTEVVQGDPRPTLWPGSLPWTLVSALGACTGGRSRSPLAWALSNVGRSWETPGKAGVMSYVSALSPLSCPRASAWHHQKGAKRAVARTTNARLSGVFLLTRWRLTFRDLQGQYSDSWSRSPGLKRKGVGPKGETGAGALGARAGSVAETHGSGSKTGEAVKDPERPVDSKPGREEQDCVGRRALEASAAPPPPGVGGQDQGGKPQC